MPRQIWKGVGRAVRGILKPAPPGWRRPIFMPRNKNGIFVLIERDWTYFVHWDERMGCYATEDGFAIKIHEIVGWRRVPRKKPGA